MGWIWISWVELVMFWLMYFMVCSWTIVLVVACLMRVWLLNSVWWQRDMVDLLLMV